MWLFTNFGFFSVVQKAGEPHLTVRARVRGDLQRLRHRYLPALGEPVHLPNHDYPWRAHCSHDALAAAMARIAADVDYPNFKNEVRARMGAARAHAYHAVWDAMYGYEEDAPGTERVPERERDGWDGLPWSPPSSPAAASRFAFGGVVVDAAGRLLLREVANGYDDYVWSFAKGRGDAGEAPRETALREVEEELGVRARILLPLPRVYAGGTSVNHYFLMVVEAGAVDLGFRCKETSSVRWATADEARALLARSTNAIGRERDLQVLADALACLPGALRSG
jgi:8-oxo-dGTP pyrophosphatase MutT (NUDIX family)